MAVCYGCVTRMHDSQHARSQHACRRTRGLLGMICQREVLLSWKKYAGMRSRKARHGVVLVSFSSGSPCVPAL